MISNYILSIVVNLHVLYQRYIASLRASRNTFSKLPLVTISSIPLISRRRLCSTFMCNNSIKSHAQSATLFLPSRDTTTSQLFICHTQSMAEGVLSTRATSSLHQWQNIFSSSCADIRHPSLSLKYGEITRSHVSLTL